MSVRTLAAGFSAALLSVLLVSCSPGGEQKANGFITENRPAPKSAKQKEGDVPRDDHGRPFQYRMLGETLPDFDVVQPDGSHVTRDDLLGHWTVLEVWGIWCPDCVTDGPNVQRLAEVLADEPEIGFLTVHSPPSAKRKDEAFGKYASVAAYFDAHGYDYPYALDEEATFKSELHLPWVPSFLLIDPDGVIRGYRSELSAAGDGAVEDFVKDVKTVMKAG